MILNKLKICSQYIQLGLISTYIFCRFFTTISPKIQWVSLLRNHDITIDITIIPQERAQVTLRPSEWFYIDLKRVSGTSDTYADSDGNVQDISLINFSGGNPNYGDQACMGGGYGELAYYDWYCTSNDSPLDLFCIGWKTTKVVFVNIKVTTFNFLSCCRYVIEHNLLENKTI